MTKRFSPGEDVRVRDDYPPGHVRTPVYIRGKKGVVTRVFGSFKNPEALAVGLDGMPSKTLYEVRFRQKDVWPNYKGSEADALLLDIYEHWLVKVSE